MLRFTTGCFSGGNYTRPLTTLGMNDHQHTPQSVHAQRDKTLLTGCIGALDSNRHCVAKRLLGMREAHAMFAKVATCLCWIEFDIHIASMHM